MPNKNKTKKLPPIPLSEWMSLFTGILIFIAVEFTLVFNGYTNLLYNSAASLIIASMSSYGIFGVQNKLKRIAKALRGFMAVVLLVPTAIIAVIAGIAWAILKIPKGIVILCKAIMASLKYLPTLVRWLGILLLNIAMIPVLAVYLTIYGMVFSLSGSTAKIMLRHYDAFGHRMIAPIEEYLYPEGIVAFIAIAIIGFVGSLILNSYTTALSITANNEAAMNAGVSFSTTALFSSYLPVLIFAIVIGIVIILLKYLLTGASAFATGATA